MNTEQLRNFSLAYQSKSFAQAARLVPMSVQGLIKSIHALEVELGVVLFQKDASNHLAPTPYADRLWQFSAQFERGISILKNDFRQIAATENQEILLGSSLGIIGFLGNSFFEKFHNQHPGITISYSEMSDKHCDERLKEGKFGLAFTVAPYTNEVLSFELYKTEICLWVPKRHHLASHEFLSIADLQGTKLALPGPDYKCYHTIAALAQSQNISFESMMFSSEMFWLYNFALEGHGVSFSATHLGKLPFFDSDAVRCIPLKDVTWSFGISMLPGHEISEAERAFLDFSLNEFKSS